MDKEYLLSKGVTEEIANQIIAETSVSEEDNSLLALQKALDGDPKDRLVKAGKGKESKEEKDAAKEDEKEEEEEDEEGEYNEKYMKKFMKKFMKENHASCEKIMKNVGGSKEKMEKAINDIDTDADGGVVEMADLAPFMKAQQEYIKSQNEMNQTMAKAIADLTDKFEIISSKSDKSFDLMQKAAKVTAEQAEGMKDFLKTPEGRKGVTSVANMRKAVEPTVSAFTPELNKAVYQTLFKAVRNGDRTAGQIISVFESHGQDANKLNDVQKKYISDLIAKGDK
jgi:hypothetical protein